MLEMLPYINLYFAYQIIARFHSPDYTRKGRINKEFNASEQDVGLLG